MEGVELTVPASGSAPLVSIVIPVRNGLPFIKQALDSALADNGVDLEVIVGENFSTDGTAEWLSTITDPRVRIVQAKDSLTAAQNWTTVCREARGTWLKVLCADDFLPEGGLRRQVEAAEAHPRAVMIASRRRVVTESGKVVLRGHGLSGFVGAATGGEVAQRAIVSGANPFGEPSSVLFRRDALEASLPFSDDHPYLTDLAMYVRVLPRGDFVGLSTVDGAFRLSTTSWSASIGNNQLSEYRDWVTSLERDGTIRLSRATRWIVNVRLRARFIARRVVTTLTSFSARKT